MPDPSYILEILVVPSWIRNQGAEGGGGRSHALRLSGGAGTLHSAFVLRPPSTHAALRPCIAGQRDEGQGDRSRAARDCLHFLSAF